MTRKEKRAKNLRQRQAIVKYMVEDTLKKYKLNGIEPESGLSSTFNRMLNVDVTLKENIRLSLPSAISELNSVHKMNIDKSKVIENIPKPMTREELDAQHREIEDARRKERQRLAKIEEQKIENNAGNLDPEIFNLFARLG